MLKHPAFWLSLALGPACTIDVAEAPAPEVELGDKADRIELAEFTFSRSVRASATELGATIDGTFDASVHLGASFTVARATRLRASLSFRNVPDNGYTSPGANLILFRRNADATSDDPNAQYQAVVESGIGADDVVRISSDVLSPGEYLLLFLPTPWTERNSVGYSVVLQTERDQPCSTGTLIERGSIESGTRTATEDGQSHAYYSARDLVERDLRTQLDAIRERCGERIDSSGDSIRLRVVSAWSKGQWVASVGLPEPELTYAYDWYHVTDDDSLAACVEVEKRGEFYGRRFTCEEAGRLDWACCDL